MNINQRIRLTNLILCSMCCSTTIIIGDSKLATITFVGLVATIIMFIFTKESRKE